MYLDQIEASIKKHHYQSTMEYMSGPNGVNIPNTLVIKKENRIVATIDMQHTGHIEINTLLNQALTMKLIKFSRTDVTARIKTVHLTLNYLMPIMKPLNHLIWLLTISINIARN